MNYINVKHLVQLYDEAMLFLVAVLGGGTEFVTSVQVHLGAYVRVKAVEASICIAKAYLDELTSVYLEDQE